jgi:hypothetical protein
VINGRKVLKIREIRISSTQALYIVDLWFKGKNLASLHKTKISSVKVLALSRIKSARYVSSFFLVVCGESVYSSVSMTTNRNDTSFNFSLGCILHM